HLFDAERFDDVADLDIVVAGDLHAALDVLADLGSVFLVALERFETGGAVGGRIDDDAVADDPHLGIALDRPLGHKAAGDGADTADLECLADDGPAQVNDLFARLELPFEGGANLVRE